MLITCFYLQGKGKMTTYWLLGEHEDTSSSSQEDVQIPPVSVSDCDQGETSMLTFEISQPPVPIPIISPPDYTLIPITNTQQESTTAATGSAEKAQTDIINEQHVTNSRCSTVVEVVEEDPKETDPLTPKTQQAKVISYPPNSNSSSNCMNTNPPESESLTGNGSTHPV